MTPRILVEAIDEMLMVQLAKERGYKLRDEQFREWLSALRKEQNLEDDAKFQAALKQEGMTIDDLRKNVERQFMISQVQREEVGSKLTITEEEARQYYASASAGVRHAGQRHAPRNPRRDADGDTGRPGRRQRGAGRRNASEGDCDPRPHPGGRGFRQGGGGGVGGALQVDRRIDRPDQRQRAVRRSCRTC